MGVLGCAAHAPVPRVRHVPDRARGRRPLRPCRTLPRAALALLTLAGCTRPALSRQEYRARVTGYCTAAQTAAGALPAATDRAALLTRLRRLRAINRRLTNRIAQLNPPIGTDQSHDK